MARILVVEDSPTQALQLEAFLEDAGYQIDVAGNGREALETIARITPDVVVTDLEMPELNGLKLVEAIRSDYPAVPVILMTAHGSEEIAALALRKGAASYVPKSYLEQDIVPTLERILSLTRPDRHRHRAMEWLTQNESTYTLHNDPGSIPPVIAHLEEILGWLGVCDQTALTRVAIALQESLVNAIDHGNLEVSSELRQKDENDYRYVIQERRQQKPYRDRHVYLTAKITAAEAVFTIRDEGPGFDPSTLPDPTDISNLERIGGRGLMLIRTFMDEVHHNDAGNTITLVKRRDE